MSDTISQQPDRVSIFHGTVEQFADIVAASLRQLYQRDTEHLAEKFELEAELARQMRQPTLKRPKGEADLSPKQIKRFKAENTALLSTGLDYYPSYQKMAEDFTFVFDESRVKRESIIQVLDDLQKIDLNTNRDDFIFEAQPLLKFLNEKKEQLSFFLQLLSSSNPYIRRTIWRCTLAYNEDFNSSAAIEAIPPLSYLNYTLVYFQDGYNAARRTVSQPIGDKFLKIAEHIIETTKATAIDFAQDEDAKSNEADAGREDPITFSRSKNTPNPETLQLCIEAAEQWLEYNKRLIPATRFAGIDKRTFINRLCDALDVIEEDKRVEWKKRIMNRGHSLEC